MSKLTSTTFVAMAAALMGVLSLITAMSVGAPRATAAPPSLSAAEMPLSSKFRACDFTPLRWVNATGFARAMAHVGSTDSGTLAASVDINTAVPDTRYDVRVIQMPRPSNDCGPGASGVLTGAIQTDSVGAGTTTLQGPIAPGATGAWVIVERPSEFSQTPVEYYTTTFVASI